MLTTGVSLSRPTTHLLFSETLCPVLEGVRSRWIRGSPKDGWFVSFGISSIIIRTDRLIKFRYLSIIVIILIPFFIISPTYDVEPLTVPLYQILNEGKFTTNSYHDALANQELLHYEESPYATITVIESDIKRMHINGKSQCAFGAYGLLRDGINLAKLPSEIYYHNFKSFPRLP